jgi:hypothetical protein
MENTMEHLQRSHDGGLRKSSETAKPPLAPAGESQLVSLDENPIVSKPTALARATADSVDVHGAFSLEKFASASSLSNTHEDAQGFFQYLEKFYPRNFWYKDENVRIWAYEEEYDNWQDTYGMDAVLAPYHSGHGGMGTDGRFHAPLGADWGGKGTTVWSDQMKLGNEQARYVFWSTCLSLCVTGGQNPIRTWSTQPNPGFRMIFGYDTTSVDDPDYGKKFWEKWNSNNRSLSAAFLDASWDISSNQRPSVAACGATEAEAKDRVFNERMLQWASVSHTWWWWRWYSKAAAVTATRPILTELPSGLLIPVFAPRPADPARLRAIAAKHNIEIPGVFRASSFGLMGAGRAGASVSLLADGSYEVQFGHPNVDNSRQIATERALDVARGFMRESGVGNEDLLLDSIGYASSAGGTHTGSGQMVEPSVTETVFKFVQAIEGVPIISGGSGGTVTIRVDNDGAVTSLANGRLEIRDLILRKSLRWPTPGEAQPDPEPKMAISRRWQSMLKEWIIEGDMPVAFGVVPGSFEVGYAVDGSTALLVARQEVEVDCGSGYRKRYIVQAPLGD